MPGRRLTDAHPDWLRPEWPATGVGALMTTRQGGASAPPWDSLNLGAFVGDDPETVAHNRRRLSITTGAAPVFLKQVHGARVLHLTAAHARADAPIEEADAAVTDSPGLACVVQVADCLPVLFAAPDGRAIGAAHAGWRGLAGGVLEATLDAICALASCQPAEVSVWLGACIGPRQFEVGPDVLDAFPGLDGPAYFKPYRPGKWYADLPGLARAHLLAAGAGNVSGGQWCTVESPSRFFSFRRDRITGRQAAAIWIDRSA